MIIDLNVTGKHVVVVGAGTEGTRKVKALLGQGCRITLISDRLNTYLSRLAREGKIEVIRKRLKDADILRELKPFLVLAATNDRMLNKSIVAKAKEIGAFAYAADDPSVSDFIHPAVINIGDTLFIAISTKGASPLMARILRIKVEKALKRIITKEDLEYIKLANFARKEAVDKIHDPESRKRYLYTIIKDENIRGMMMKNRLDDAKQAAMEILERWT